MKGFTRIYNSTVDHHSLAESIHSYENVLAVYKQGRVWPLLVYVILRLLASLSVHRNINKKFNQSALLISSATKN